MLQTRVFNILDFIELAGEDVTKIILSSFSCPFNPEIERFLKDNAIQFAKRKMSITYLVLDSNNEQVAFFTLTHKPALIPAGVLSNRSKKKMERYAKVDEATDSYTVSAFLIAQHIIGGGVIFLECEDNEKLLSFYQNEHNNYQVYGERVSESENITYKQLLRFF